MTGAALADQKTLLAFGDSLTQGYGLPAEDGFVPTLERWLNDAGADVRVVNGGVSGETTAGGAARIDWTLGDDFDAVIVALGGNDALRGLPVDEARANLTLILDRIRAKGLPVLLIGVRAPGNFGAAYQRDFAAMYENLAAEFDVPLFPSFLQGLEDLDDYTAVLREYMQSDGLHPNATGIDLVVERIGPAVLTVLSALDNS